jgi:mRNA interferase RelE/StbE
MYGITFSTQALKELKKVPKPVVSMIKEKLETIAGNPFTSHQNGTKLQGRTGYRLRIGDWRVIYEIEKQKVVILVIKIGHKSEVDK